ncbi:MAG: hypothetical protein NPINA01_15870 [Nitrospinaceae bacterium]|nr:MAG: hypothetical protein NPINA01_15870 [Nitrospinaceae bacterium]
MEREMKDNLSKQLQAILSSNVESLNFWIKEKKLDAEVLASQPEIREKLISLINIAKKEDLPATILKQTEELKWLREHLGNACKKYGFVGFVVLDPTGFQVGSYLDDALGKRQLIQRSDFFYRSLQGDTVVSHPFPGEVDLPDNQGNWQPDRPTMFTSAPILNDSGNVMGVLAFRFRPEMEFTHMLEVSRFGKTGESYAFNIEGLMLTHSRFLDQLKKQRLLPNDIDTSAILNVQLREPRKKSSPKANFQWQRKKPSPLTRMAASAVKGESGVDVNGYFGYRGVQVVGAWIWLPGQYMGIATEIEAPEAFGPLYAISRGFLAVLGLLAVATLIAFLMHLFQMRLQKEKNLANKHVRETEKKIKSLAKFPSENPNPVLRIAGDGKLLYANAPAFTLLNDMTIQVGDLVFPEFQANAAYALSSKSIQEIATQVGKRTFLLQWVPILNEGYVNIYAQDITERKEAEEKLLTYAKLRVAINKLSQLALSGPDFQELMDHAVHLLSQTIDLEFSNVLKFIPEDHYFLLQAGRGWKEGLVGKTRIPGDMGSQANYILKTNGPVVVTDLKHESRFRSHPFLLDHGIVSGMSVTIHSGARVVGILGGHTRRARVFKNDEINFLQSMANILGSAMERKDAEEKLEQKAWELERSNQELEDFAFIASHDLQEPLRKVMLFGDRIKSTYPSSGDDRGKDYIDRLQKSMYKMQDFIRDLLEYSRVTRSQGQFTVVRLEDIVEESLGNLEEQIKRTQGVVEVLALPSVTGDRFQLGQLIQNLISNALKYSKENVTPEIKIRALSHGNSAWDIRVEDNGIGMDPKYFNKIFKPFERLHSNDRYGGTGIGLAICAKVLTRHSGTIRVESELGKGSTFILTLPKIQATASPSKIIQETETLSR